MSESNKESTSKLKQFIANTSDDHNNHDYRKTSNIRDPAFIRTRTSKPPAFIRDCRLFETRRLI